MTQYEKELITELTLALQTLEPVAVQRELGDSQVLYQRLGEPVVGKEGHLLRTQVGPDDTLCMS